MSAKVVVLINLRPLSPDTNIKRWILNSLVALIFWGWGNINYSSKYRENKYFGKQYVNLLNVKLKLSICHADLWAHNMNMLCLHVHVIASKVPKVVIESAQN
jgi:hypothetical protein